MPDVNGLGEKIVSSVRGYVARSLEALEARIAALEERPTTAAVRVDLIDAIDKEVDGIDSAIRALSERIATLEARPTHEDVLRVAQAVSDSRIDLYMTGLPAPPDLTPLTEKIAALEARPLPEVTADTIVEFRHNLEKKIEQRLQALPPSVDLAPLTAKVAELETRPTDEEVLKLAQGALTSTRASMIGELHAAIDQHFAALPIPEKGDKGDPGINGLSVTVEQFRDMFEASYAKFELAMERRIMDVVQRTLDRIPVPKDGKDGRDGEDGFDLRHFDMVQIDERSFMLRFKDLNREKTGTITLPVPIERGIWREGGSYRRGDLVTWGGSGWVKQTDEPGGKPEDGASWRLFVKRGRDGKDGEKGDKGDPGKAGRNGRDLTQLGADGSKW